MLVDKYNVIIANGHSREVLGKNIKDTNSNIAEAVMNGKNNSFIHTSIGKAYISTYTIPSTDWVLIGILPYKEFITPIITGLIQIAIPPFLAMIICMLFMYKIATNITKPILNVVDAVDKVSQGYLNEKINVNQKDEIGRLANAVTDMQNSIIHIVDKIKMSSNNITDKCSELTISSETMKCATEDSENKCSQMALSIDAMATTLRDVAHNMEEIASKSAGSANLASQGIATSREAIASINGLMNIIKRVSDVMVRFEENASAIGNIVNVINDIADQTNLLALNAAIEAARAGESGRGFAVVADEVRKLAEKSSSSTNEINNMIKNIQDDVKETMMQVEEAQSAAENSVEGSNKTNNALAEIDGSITDLDNYIQRIVASVEELSSTSEEVAASINNILESNQNSKDIALSQHLNIADVNLSVSELKEEIKRFK